MLLSFCPGGVTSNILSKLAKGRRRAFGQPDCCDQPILSILTVPVLAAWSIASFYGRRRTRGLDQRSLAIAMFLITTLPVAIGVSLFATLQQDFANSIEDGHCPSWPRSCSC